MSQTPIDGVSIDDNGREQHPLATLCMIIMRLRLVFPPHPGRPKAVDQSQLRAADWTEGAADDRSCMASVHPIARRDVGAQILRFQRIRRLRNARGFFFLKGKRKVFRARCPKHARGVDSIEGACA